jgi:hypothetical protein
MFHANIVLAHRILKWGFWNDVVTLNSLICSDCPSNRKMLSYINKLTAGTARTSSDLGTFNAPEAAILVSKWFTCSSVQMNSCASYDMLMSMTMKKLYRFWWHTRCNREQSQPIRCAMLVHLCITTCSSVCRFEAMWLNDWRRATTQSLQWAFTCVHGRPPGWAAPPRIWATVHTACPLCVRLFQSTQTPTPLSLRRERPQGEQAHLTRYTFSRECIGREVVSSALLNVLASHRGIIVQV